MARNDIATLPGSVSAVLETHLYALRRLDVRYTDRAPFNMPSPKRMFVSVILRIHGLATRQSKCQARGAWREPRIGVPFPHSWPFRKALARARSPRLSYCYLALHLLGTGQTRYLQLSARAFPQNVPHSSISGYDAETPDGSGVKRQPLPMNADRKWTHFKAVRKARRISSCCCNPRPQNPRSSNDLPGMSVMTSYVM